MRRSRYSLAALALHVLHDPTRPSLLDAFLWKPFSEDAIPPKFVKQKKKPQKVEGKVAVSLFMNGWCSAQNIVYERTKRAIQDFPDNIELNEVMDAVKPAHFLGFSKNIHHELDLNRQAPGVYSVLISLDEEVYFKRVVIR